MALGVLPLLLHNRLVALVCYFHSSRVAISASIVSVGFLFIMLVAIISWPARWENKSLVRH